MKNNRKKSEQLGMPLGTASGRLRKNVLFSLVQRLGEDICFQCGERIKSIDNFSIEHKVPYLDSDDPVGLFFDLENIAFSHLRCNVRAARRQIGTNAVCGTISKYRYGCRCDACKSAERDYATEFGSKRLDDGDVKCGTYTKYAYGCRCDECRKTNAEKQRNYYRKPIELKVTRSQCGTINKYKQGCRCNLCKKEGAERQREYRKRINASVAQRTGQLPSKQKIVGSSPTGSAYTIVAQPAEQGSFKSEVVGSLPTDGTKK